MKNSIILNVGYIFIAQIASRLISFFYVIFLARNITVEEFGYLNFVLSVVLLADVIADLGISRFLLQKLSLNLAYGKVYVDALIVLKVFSAALSYGMVVFLVLVAGYEQLVVQLVSLVALGLLFTALAAALEPILQSQSRFPYISLAHIALVLVQLGTGLAVIAIGSGVLGIAATFVLTNFVYAATVYFGVRRLGVSIRPRLDIPLYLEALPKAAPYAIIFCLFMLSTRIELLALGWFQTGQQLGLYSIAVRIMDAALAAPLALGTVLAPRFISLHQSSPQQLEDLYSWVFRLVVVLSILGTLMAIAFSEPLMGFLLPQDYEGVWNIIDVLFLAYPFASVYYLNLALMLGSDQQRNTVFLVSGLVAAQMLFSIVAVSSYGVEGAAIAFSLSMFVASAMSTLHVRRLHVGGANILHAAYPGLAGAVLVAGLFLRDDTFLGLWIDMAALFAYAIIALLLMRRFPSNSVI